MKWFVVTDAYSGGFPKTRYLTYYIQAHEVKEVIRIFHKYTKQNISAVHCECCGRNYYLYEITPEDIERDSDSCVIPYSPGWRNR